MESKDSIRKVIEAIGKDRTYPALSLVQSNPETAAMISKLITPPNQSRFDLTAKNSENRLNRSQIQAVSDSTKNRISDNENITQIFPDIELAIQILISSMLSPKDMVKTDLIYRAVEPIFPSELIMKLNQVAQGHLEGHYKVTSELQEILRHALFETGSHIKVVIPESVIDEIINQNQTVSTESLSPIISKDKEITSLGILGNAGPKSSNSSKVSYALESFFSTEKQPIVYDSKIRSNDKDSFLLDHLEVTDNYQLLKLPKIIERANAQRIKEVINKDKISTEAFKVQENSKITANQMKTISYKDQGNVNQNFLIVPDGTNSKRKNVGRPLVMRLPSESVIPVYIPGDEKKHVGYFVLVDVDGNPVNRTTIDNSPEALSGLAGLSQGNTGQNNSMASALLAKAKKNLAGQDAVPTIDNITSVYSSIIETNLMERLSNGLYGANVAIAKNEEVYRIMLARSLSAKFTRLLYIPSDLTTYFAFQFHANGTGKSYLDSVKNLTSLRAILLYSKVMAQVKSAISLTHVGMTLDPNDPDPLKTIEIATHEVTKMRQQYFPLGINSPVDLVNWIQRAGLEFSFEGHPGLPQTKFDFEAKTMQRDVPDNELDEMLRKQTYMAFGLSPETVDNGFNSEFATSVVANNVLLSKRVIQLQNIFTPLLSDYARKLLRHDAYALKELKAVLEDNIGLIEKSLSEGEKAALTSNKDKFLVDTIDRYLDNLYIDLPQPDVTTLTSQSEAFEQYETALDKALDSWISSNFMTTDLAGDASSNIDSIKAVLKAHFLRQWMSSNGYMSELNDIVTATEDGKPTLDVFDMNKNHMAGLLRSCMKFLEAIQPTVLAANKDLETLGVAEGTSTSTDSSSDSGDGGGDDFDIGGDMGMGDLDMGGEAPPGDTPVDDTEKPTEDESPKKDEAEDSAKPGAP